MIIDSVTIHFCAEHVDTPLEEFYPGYVFNCLTIQENKKCRIDGCYLQSIMKLVGYKVPEKVPVKLQESYGGFLAVTELLEDAFEMMALTPAEQALTMYLFYKIRIYPCGGDTPAMLLCKIFAGYVLNKLKIHKDKILNRNEVHEILKELRLYPPDYEG